MSYIIGGLDTLSAYIIMDDAKKALVVSVIVTIIALGVFGGIKGKFTGGHPLKSALQTILIGGLAAGAAFAIAKWIA